MADRISDERLREIVDGTYCGFDEGIAIAAELLAARETIRSKDRLLPSLIAEGVALERESMLDDLKFLDDVRRENQQLRAEVERLRAHGEPPNWLKLGDAADWNTRYGKLLAKHKEAEQ